MAKITNIHARELLDSRGNPTIEAEVTLDSGVVGSAIVPSGASTGAFEALELRDGDSQRFYGKGVLKAVDHVCGPIRDILLGADPENLAEIDGAMIEADGTANKAKFGANAILAASMASARAAAQEKRVTLAEWIGEKSIQMGYVVTKNLPIPMLNVINGGAHANNGLDIQEFMIVPHGFDKFNRALRAACEVFWQLKSLLNEKGYSVAVGDEGGFAPQLKTNEEAMQFIMLAIERSGYKPGEEISLALDVASTELYDQKAGCYMFSDEEWGKVHGVELIDCYQRWVDKYPLISIEDGASEDDWATWYELTNRLGDKVQLVGDDLFVTQQARLQEGIDKKCSNSILIKLNQVGTLWETLQTMKLAKEHDLTAVVSHRSGESEDSFIAHLAVGTGAGQIKTGSASRSDRIAKYNELLRLEERLDLTYAKRA